MMIILLSAFSVAPIAPMAGLSNTTQLKSSTVGNNSLKTVNKAPVILLAANDVTSLQGMDAQSSRKNLPSKQAAPAETTNALSDIPAQAWLILAALFCFVMRSSRRVV